MPEANAIWAGDRIVKLKPSDVAVAVAVAVGAAAARPRRVVSVCLFSQPEPGQPFRIAERFRLAG